MSLKRFIKLLAYSGSLMVILAACSPQTVEVTRVVEVESDPQVVTVVETRVVERDGETVVEEVEVTVVVEATPVPPPQGGDVVESTFSDINSLNPLLGNDSASSDVYGQMFVGLTNLDPFSGAVVPDLAESWDVSADGLVYTFNLRDDVLWSDGTQLTAADVAFSFDAINNDAVASPRRSNFTNVASWRVVDDFTFEVTFSSVDCTFLPNQGGIGVVPAHVYDNDPENVTPENPEILSPSVVSGPFMFEEWVPDDRTRLVANPNYFRGQPNVDSWTYRVYADQSAELAGLLANEHDYTLEIGPQFVSRIEGEIASGSNMSIRKYFDNGYLFVGYNLANPDNPQNGWDDLDGDGSWSEGEPPLAQDPHPILSELAVRQAIAYSLDYNGIINKVAFGQGSPTVANVWPSIEWAYNNEIEPYAQDLEMAAQILADAGWTAGSQTNDAGVPILEKDGEQLTLGLMTNAGNETRENIGILMKDVLDDLGFNIELEYIEFGTVVQNLLGQSFDMLIIGFGGGAPDPDDSSQFSYINDEVGAGFNFVSYYNETVEDNLAQGKAVPGCAEEDRAPFYKSNQEQIYNDLPYSFFMVELESAVWWNDLETIDPNPWSKYYNIHEWSIAP